MPQWGWSSLGLVNVRLLGDACRFGLGLELSVHAGVPQQSAALALLGFQFWALDFELGQKLGGVRGVVGAGKGEHDWPVGQNTHFTGSDRFRFFQVDVLGKA
jgi:hypothetical protein